MTKEEMVDNLIERYCMLQRIKKANGETKNAELDYEIKTTEARLQVLSVKTEDLKR